MSSNLPSTRTEAPAPPNYTRTGRGDDGHKGTRLLAVLAAVLAVIALIVAAIALLQDDDDDVTTGTSTTAAPTTTATSTPAQTDTTTAVFPFASTDVRFDDPVEAARAFAVDFVGFTDPVVGEFMQGDVRSGEVEIRPSEDGAVTTVFVRQLGPDDTWFVLGSATADITVTQPETGATISSPVTVSGEALAFEGVVNVEVREDGTIEPLGTGNVVGGGGPAAPFEGEIEFSTPTQDYGALVFLTRSEEDGSIVEAGVMRVRFG